jgi:hypothetical protein
MMQKKHFIDAEKNKLINALTEAKRAGNLNLIDLSKDELEIEENLNQAIYDGKELRLNKEYELENDQLAKLEILRDNHLIGQKEYEDELLKIKLEAFQKEIDAYAKLGESVTKIWSNANRMLDAKDKQRLNQIQENNDKALEKVQKMYDQGVISKEDYDNRIAELNNKMDNESKQLEMESAKRHAELAIFEQSIATAVAIANGIKLALSTAKTHWAEAVAAAAIVVGEVVALMAAASEYQVAVPQSAKGKYPVRGQDDGQLYNASFAGPVQTGYYSQPTLGLFSEKGPEIVVDAPTVRNIQMNQPEIIDAIYAMRVPQHAAGMYPASIPTQQTVTSQAANDQQMAIWLEILNEIRKPKKNYITMTDLEQAQETKQTIESAVTRNRSI